MTRLTTSYLGLELRSPIVASASPFTGEIETAQRIAAAGAGAIVLPSLFEEEIVHDETSLQDALHAGADHFAEALDFYPGVVQDFPSVADRYVNHLAELKKWVDVPIIASLNATSSGGWTRYARLLEEAGADALELNLYRVAADPERSGADVEKGDIELVRGVASSVSLPLAVKLSPYYSSMANFGPAVVEAGAAGLVLFNRFYQPDLDVDTREVVVKLELSHPWEIRLPLRWIAILRPLLGRDASIALTSGVHDGRDVAKALLAGADVAMTTSALLRNGPEHLAVMHSELEAWLEANDYGSVDELRGSVSYASSEDPGAFERSNYMKTLHSWTAPPNLTPASPSS
jgi:dihydroorotate dehydrogenase (fumarate)